MTTKEKVEKQLEKFIPQEFTNYIANLLFSEKVAFKVSKPRKTKLGDYRPPLKTNIHKISVNGDLNPYSFLITTLHEFAHMHTYINHGWQVLPHGEEWKKEFKILLQPLLISESIPKDIRLALSNTVKNIKASSCSDIALNRVLKRYDKKQEHLFSLEELKNNQSFKINGKTMSRLELRRKRFLCKEISTGKLFLVHRLAEVEIIK